MRRLVLASYDKIMLNINAVIMLQKRGEPAMNNVTIGMDFLFAIALYFIAC
jgi:hypothetical protein